ncbi:uncharacterized protein OCT59_016963 [Rhizophagus irregularis]|nr:hypothetical protein OCT59_016963 [Rhizophagus irregularis]
MDDTSVKINDDANKIEIEVDKIDVDKNYDVKIFTFDNELHNGKPITMIEISPKETYLITYSEKDSSIVGWNVEDIDKVRLKFHQTVKINEDKKYEIESLSVSDDKKLAYIDTNDGIFGIIDMNNKDKKIALDLNTKNDYHTIYYYNCTFNLKGEFILCGVVGNNSTSEEHDIIWIYSTQTKNNKWECKRFYRLPYYYEIISISKYDKVYLFSYENDYIYEWNINTEKSVKIFVNSKKIKIRNIGIFSNEKFNILKVNDIIIVYSIELGISIASLDINDDIQLYNFMNRTGLFLLPSLIYYTSDKEINYCWNSKYKNWRNETEPTNGILNERVWKSEFYENMSKTKVIEYDDDDKQTYNHLNVHSINPYMNTVSTLFQNATAISDYTNKLTESVENLIKWEIYIYSDDDKIRLEVFKKINTEWELISTRIENHPYKSKYSNHRLI